MFLVAGSKEIVGGSAWGNIKVESCRQHCPSEDILPINIFYCFKNFNHQELHIAGISFFKSV